MMGNLSIGLGLLCAAMMALMCLPMAIGMIRGWVRRQRTDTPTTEPVAEHASLPGTSTPDS